MSGTNAHSFGRVGDANSGPENMAEKPEGGAIPFAYSASIRSAKRGRNPTETEQGKRNGSLT